MTPTHSAYFSLDSSERGVAVARLQRSWGASACADPLPATLLAVAGDHGHGSLLKPRWSALEAVKGLVLDPPNGLLNAESTSEGQL